MNLLDAAYDFLKSAGVSMTAQEIVDPILKAGLWTTAGKTPDATLAARIYMDIKKNGSRSRFVKAGKGRFALSGCVVSEESAQPTLFDGMEKSASAHHEQPDPVLEAFKPRTGKISDQTFSFTDCAEKVLRGQGRHKPMHYSELTRIALANGWLATSGKTPESTMYAQIIQEIQRLRKRGEVPRFVQCGKGCVALTAWDKAGVDFQIQQHHEDVRKKLKAKLMALKPEEFEDLVSKLFAAMGFREVSRTRLSGDGGIDVRGTMITIGSGIIRTELAIQVKRWRRNVQAPIVQQVRGSLGAHEQGCIVTTSDFSEGARKEATKSDKTPIALIDGKELMNLMMEHQVGVRRKEVPLFEVCENLLNDGE